MGRKFHQHECAVEPEWSATKRSAKANQVKRELEEGTWNSRYIECIEGALAVIALLPRYVGSFSLNRAPRNAFI